MCQFNIALENEGTKINAWRIGERPLDMTLENDVIAIERPYTHPLKIMMLLPSKS